ncbi:type VI secretion system protein ImpK [Desulfosarcina ovata subsp. sediminis]|uniref:Type VI secretion system protein ImpK n=1 Tax=Desulfosarcina ovata subsp. sediminis TaxID=885957 RepID=A0A5K7ZKT2_9BACT|nr:DotU family type IV/VI secretion system protein [Desulfosarcina ovata]BBO81521.1 type VI secretion system protein ImpK [Desulfosarcina ovata subsp. sediminis]
MRLSDCFVELIAYTALVIRPDGGKVPFDQVDADIRRLITESEGCCQNSGFPSADYDLARFAVFAWIDETVLSSQWEGKGRWLGEQLQRRYYNTSDAGKLFFERLNTIGPHQQDVREVYYLCLAMGFIGQYCNEGDDYLLEQLKISNLKVLTGSSMGLPDLKQTTLFPDAYAPANAQLPAKGPRKRRFSAFTLLCAGTPVLFFGLLFLIYRFILGNIGQSLINAGPK